MARASQRAPTSSPVQDSSALLEKMNRLETALALMNEERKHALEDNETVLLKQKLAAFETKLAEVAEAKKLAAVEDQGSAMREQFMKMERKLQNMERRKSVNITLVMQQKMQEVEKQLEAFRIQGASSGSDSRVTLLERKLSELQNTHITPAMVNDPETNALRAHVRKLEEGMKLAEKKMEEQRIRVEEERMLARKKQQEQEEEFRREARRREDLLLQKMAELEKGLSQRAAVKPAAASSDALQRRLEQLERQYQNSASSSTGERLLVEMENRLKEAEAALAKKNSETVLQAFTSTSSPSEKDSEISLLIQKNALLMDKLEQTNQRFENEINTVKDRVANLARCGPASSSMAKQSGLSFQEINARLGQIQTKLFDENTPENEVEVLNIEYEKLISELEQTSEYQKEQEELVNAWKRENEPLNRAALEQTREKLATMSATDRAAFLSKKPELKFLGFTPDQISKKHVNDFKATTTQNLDETEARALFACMPQFRKEQEKQLEFVEQLKTKIETEVKKPKTKPMPPVQAAKKVIFRKPPPGAANGGFLEELVKRRKQIY